MKRETVGSNPIHTPKKCLSSSVVRAPTWYVGGHGFVAVYGSNKINASIALVVDCASLVKRNYTSGVRIPLLAQINKICLRSSTGRARVL